MVDSFICTSDMGDALLSFIGSDDYKRIVNSINSDKESAFAAGVAVAVSVMLVRCPKYVGHKNNQDPETTPEDRIGQEPADISEANISEYD